VIAGIQSLRQVVAGLADDTDGGKPESVIDIQKLCYEPVATIVQSNEAAAEQ